MKKLIFLSFILLFLVNSTSAQTKKELRAEKERTAFEATKKLIDSGHFVFKADWATTQGGKRINLLSNPNFLKVEGEQVEADMPYFGVSQSPSVGYAGTGGIEFKGKADDYKKEFNEKKKRTTIKFRAQNKSESFNSTLIVFRNGSATLNISSNSRNSISYDGRVSEIVKKE